MSRCTVSPPPSPCFITRWHSSGYDVQITDTSTDLAALALQGPTARKVLEGCTSADLKNLKFFGATHADINGIRSVITRTGSTGDLGYEVWAPSGDAIKLWDTVMEAGRPHNAHVAGMDALDVCRVEAGFIMMGVDYTGAFHAVNDRQKSSPYELGLGWTVKLDIRALYRSRRLRREKERGSEGPVGWTFLGSDRDAIR